MGFHAGVSQWRTHRVVGDIMALILLMAALAALRKCDGFQVAIARSGAIPLQTVTAKTKTMTLFMTRPPYGHPKQQQQQQQHHVYKHLFRHYDDISFDSWVRCAEPIPFLRSVGLTREEIQHLDKTVFPNNKLQEMVVHDQVAPKVRFLVETLHGGSGHLTWSNQDGSREKKKEKPRFGMMTNQKKNGNDDDDDDDDDDDTMEEECSPNFSTGEGDGGEEEEKVHDMQLSTVAKQVLPHFLSPRHRLDQVVGPRHAFLVQHNLPHGQELLENQGDLFLQFLNASKLSEFVQLCHSWKQKTGNNNKNDNDEEEEYFTESMVQDFCYEFGAGLAVVAKKYHHPSHKEQTSEQVNMIPLLLQHGANDKETDSHGVSPLHYAAGTGNLAGVQALLQQGGGEPGDTVIDKILWDVSAKDGATAFHWACCGIDEYEIGTGGSQEVCQWMLDQAGYDIDTNDQRLRLLNARTFSNATPLMWAAWSGSLDIVKWLLREGADPTLRDSHGGSKVGHWAAVGGDLETCQYLVQNGIMDLTERDDLGHSPIDYASQNQEQSPELFNWITVQQHSETDGNVMVRTAQ